MMPRPALVLLCLLAVGCGKKGPPLAPIVRIPAQVEQISARRMGADVYVTLTVPQQNVDASTPADISRVDIYGYTGRVAPPRARWAELGTMVASVPVVAAPRPGDPPQPPPDPGMGGLQGGGVSVLDRLTDDELVQGPVETPPARGVRGTPPPAVAATPTASPSLRRFYLAIPFSPRGRPGPPGAAAELPLAGLPDAPAAIVAAYDAATISLGWSPAGGIIGFLLDREIPLEPPPYADDLPQAAAVADIPSGPTQYNVYRRTGADPLALPGPAVTPVPWRATSPQPLNMTPLPALTLTDTTEFEIERCYTVRAVRGVAPHVVESDPSPPACIRPIDIFPPGRPAAPAAVAAEGAISLIWEPSSEADLGGYMVLRGEAGDATLQPLTLAPITDASYRDATVVPGRRYVYAIVAVDNRVPLGNVSPPSERIEETAR